MNNENITLNEKNISFTISDFMVSQLRLGGVTLLVYALIYSFTRAGGSCYGSIDYICRRVGASRSTVIRALRHLTRERYVIKIDDDSILTNRLVANMSITAKINLSAETDEGCQNDTQEKKIGECQNDTAPVSERHPPHVKMTPNNKDNNKDNIKTTTTNNTFFLTEKSLCDGKTKPVSKTHFMFFGPNKKVVMTMHQYVKLLTTLGVLQARHYVRSLDHCLTYRSDIHFKNHYKTILRWAKEDAMAE